MCSRSPIFKNILFLLILSTLTLGLGACKHGVPGVEEDAAMEETQDDEFFGTVKDLMKRGDMTCTFTRTDEGGTLEGTVYVARDGRMAGDFTMKHPQFGTMNMHTIRDGDYGYTWGFPSETEGMKVKLDDDGMPTKRDAKGDPGIDDPMQYTCTRWRVDASKFRVPSGVNFQDISAQVEKIEETMKEGMGVKCDACNQVPEGPAREQCKAALGCT